MALDGDRVVRCLAAVDAYRASGQRATAWANANGVSAKDLASWCAHAAGWRAWLGGEVSPRSKQGRDEASGRSPEVSAQVPRFAALPVLANAPMPGAQVAITWPLQARSLTLSWPLAHAQELAQWLKGLDP